MRALRLLPLVLVAACTGLEFDRGNTFPCDFSLPPGERDLACVGGDVCGSDNLCKRYLYEGPRFENVPTLPSYGPGTAEGVRLHPLVLDRPLETVMAAVPRVNERDLLAQAADGTRFALSDGVVLDRVPALPEPPLTGFGPDVARVQTWKPENAGPLTLVMLQDSQQRLAVGLLSPMPGMRAQALGSRGAFKVLEGEPAGPAQRNGGANAFAWDGASLGVVTRDGLGVALTPLVEASAPILDVAAITQPRRQWLLILEDDGLEILERADRRGGADAGVVLDAGVEFAAELVPLTNPTGSLRTDPGGRVVAALRHSTMGVQALDVLSTFQVNIGTTGPALTSPWPDCRPCALGQRVVLFSPTVVTGAPAVEVVCTSERQAPVALRIVGSVALSQNDACVSEQLELPVPFARVATKDGRPVQWESQDSLLVGGEKGELWSGDSIAQLKPFFLDRVPHDVTQATVFGQPSLAVVTDDYLAVLEPPQLAMNGLQRNGFRRVTSGELGASDDATLLGFVRGVNGWGVTNAGAVVRLNSSGGDAGALLSVSEGPALITSDGEPIRDSIGGEAFLDVDGGLGALFFAADDSLYFLPDPEAFLDTADEYVLTPDLTPEPSVPIRSLALERTPLGTNGDDAARGYLVTSRNVYEWQLGGQPARWSARPIDLSAGEPLEVWFDRPRSALGRVGFTDGTVYTLPGGYQLAEPTPGQVRDYENLGGWPVAYTSAGLFIAGWDFDGKKLQNRFADGGVNRPMTWRRVTLPDGTEPWMGADGEAREGRLFVTVDGLGKEYRLVVFLEDLVVQVATHLRK